MMVSSSFWSVAGIIGFFFGDFAQLSVCFGNIYAGESILDVDAHMVPYFGLAASYPFLTFWKSSVGSSRPWSYVMTAIFTLLIAQHSPGEEAH